MASKKVVVPHVLLGVGVEGAPKCDQRVDLGLLFLGDSELGRDEGRRRRNWQTGCATWEVASIAFMAPAQTFETTTTTAPAKTKNNKKGLL